MFKLAVAAGAVAVSAWSHDDQDAWVDEFPTCGNSLQSPIDIKNTIPKSNNKLPNLHLDYPETVDVMAWNDGYRLAVTMDNPTAVSLTGGLLGDSDTYNLAQFNIKWKSEHKIEGKRKDAEIQFVFGDVSSTAADSTAIYAVTVKKGSKNKELQTILDSITSLVAVDSSESFANFNIKKIFPDNFRKEFYFYRGSLTAPPCYQTVQWYVARKHLTMSNSQLKALKTLLDSNSEEQDRNDREEQKINARSVFRSFSTDAEDQAEMDDLLEQFAGLGR
jgi:carbonic anhydrase